MLRVHDELDAGSLRERGVRPRYPRQPADPTLPNRRLTAELAYASTRRGLPALLRHGDRNSMRFSVESRVPFLTTDMADFVFSLPERYLISELGETKSVFRAAMRGIVPDVVLDRRDKIGFATPEIQWLSSLSGTVREWIGNAADIEFIKPVQLVREFDRMLTGQASFTWQAWRWINFCRWHARVFQHMNEPQAAAASEL